MGYNQEAYDAECAAIVRTLNIAAERQQRKKLERLTIFTDAQAPITRMQTCEVGRQQYALQTRKALEKIKCPVEIRWCPAHSGIHPGQREGGCVGKTRGGGTRRTRCRMAPEQR